MSKLGLGTVQFGLKYGINNPLSRVSKTEALKILKHCAENDVKLLDTAPDYGDSESVLGDCFLKIRSHFNVVSKLPNCDLNDVENIFFATLKKLGQKKIYGYLIHDFNFYEKNPSVWNRLSKLKNSGRIDKIGFSIYYPWQLKKLFSKKVNFDIVQVPYSVIDQRFERTFADLKEKKVEIHARSVFLQGLLFKKLARLDKFFEPLAQKLLFLRSISLENRIDISSLLLGFVHLNKNIDMIIIGVDSLNNLRENLQYPYYLPKVKALYNQLRTLSEKDERLTLPINWKMEI